MNRTFHFKVWGLTQLVKPLVPYRLGALPEVAGSNPGGSMKNYHTLVSINRPRCSSVFTQEDTRLHQLDGPTRCLAVYDRVSTLSLSW